MLARKLELGEYCGLSVARRRVHGFLFTENRFAPDMFIDRHQHDHPHFTLILEGGFTETYEGQSFECGPGTILFVPANQPHTDKVWPEGAHTVGVEISPAIMKRVQEHLKVLDSPNLLSSETLQRTAKRLYAEFCLPDSSASIALESLALEILVLASRAKAATGEPRWMTDLRQHLHETFAEPVSMAELASYAGVHESHLARAFNRHHGCTVGEYLRRLRLEAASRQLANTQDSLAEIAVDVGFFDQAHFSRAFRSVYGVPPSEYRKLMRSG